MVIPMDCSPNCILEGTDRERESFMDLDIRSTAVCEEV